MKSASFPWLAGLALLLFALSGIAFAAQDRYALKVPGGLAFADFKGYQNWQYVAVSETKDQVKIIAANQPMIDAYRAGVPGNGQAFPEGSKAVKIEWSKKPNTLSPYAVSVPNALQTLAFIEKDSKRFPDTHGWAFAAFDYDTGSDTFKPSATAGASSGAKCGYACHTAAAKQDYIFTAYPRR